jgi:hypothetical protein
LLTIWDGGSIILSFSKNNKHISNKKERSARARDKIKMSPMEE